MVALGYLDRAIFTAVSGGTGAFAQASAVAGYQTMTAAGALSGQQYGYSAQSSDLSQWEVGYGLWNGTTLTRTVLFNSIGNTSIVNFSAPPQIMITTIAESLELFPRANGNITFYVSPTGNDLTAIPGDINHPYGTAQGAMSALSRYDWQMQWGWTIQFLDGTYSGAQSSINFTDQINNIEANILGHNGDATKVILNDCQFQMWRSNASASVTISWLTFNTNANSCINPENGAVTVGGDLIFAGTATPFYLEGHSLLAVDNVNITVTSSLLQWFVFCGPGVALFSHTHIIFPASLTFNNGFTEIVTPWDNTDIGIAFLQIGAPTWTNFAGATGPRISFAGGFSSLTTENGEITDLPGNSNGTIFPPFFVSKFSAKAGTIAQQGSGLPTTSNVPQSCWAVYKDTSGGGVYMAYNDAGTIKKVALV